jgi:hypothetical protein
LRAEFSLLCAFKFGIHNHGAISAVKIALALDRELCMSSPGRIRELR